MDTITFTYKNFFDMLRGDSTYHPQICDKYNTFIVNAEQYVADKYGAVEIFITPALFSKGVRTKNNFKEVRVLWAEIDDIRGTPDHLFVLKPTLLVRTSQTKDANGKQLNSYHAWWALDAPIKRYSIANEGLNLIKDVLKTVVDNGGMKVAGLMRLPLSFRHKESDRQGKEVINQVEVMYYNHNLVYSYDDFEIWRKLPIKARKSVCNKPHKHKRSEADFFAMASLVSVGASKSLIKKIFTYAAIGDKFRERGDDYFDLTHTKVCAVARDLSVTHNVFERGGKLVFENDNGTEELTDFIPEYVETLIPYDDNGMLLHHIRINGSDVYLTQLDISEKSKFVKKIGNFGTMLAPRHYMVQLQKYIIAQQIDVDNSRHYTNSAGVIKYKDVYERIPSGQSLLIFNPSDTSQLSNIRYDLHKGDVNGLATVVKAFTELNNPTTTQVMLGWFTLSFFKSFIREEDIPIRFPILMVGGGANSGKTTLITHLFELFGMKNVQGSALAGKITDFVLTKALTASETMPLFIKEFRANAGYAAEQTSTILRSSYDETSTSRRGNADQSVTEYVMRRCIIVDGQDTFEEPAMIGRTLTVFVSSKHRQMSKLIAYRDAVRDNNSFAYHLIDKILTDMNLHRGELIQRIKDKHSEMLDVLSDMLLDDRSKSNLGILWFGITYLYDFLGMEYPEPTDLLVCYDKIFNKEMNYLRNDATVILEYVLSMEKSVTVNFGGNSGNSSDDEDRYVEFNLARKVRSFNRMVAMSGMARTQVLSIASYKLLLNEHGLFVTKLPNGLWQIDKVEAHKYGLGQ